jgi:DNA-binding NtrC family response regulator
VAHFLKDKLHPVTKRPVQVTRQAMEVLCAHAWPGNVRELENAIERAMTLCEGGIIQAGDLPPSLLAIVKTNSPSADASAAMTLPVVPESALYPLRSALAPGAAPNGGQAGEEPVLPLKTYLQRQELAHLNRAIQQCGGDKEQAALLLGISKATLYRRMGGEDKEA